MRNLHKLLLPVSLFLMFPILISCQATPAASSSVIEEVAVDIEADTCADLRLPLIDEAEFNSASQYWRDLVLAQNAAWQARCT